MKTYRGVIVMYLLALAISLPGLAYIALRRIIMSMLYRQRLLELVVDLLVVPMVTMFSAGAPSNFCVAPKPSSAYKPVAPILELPTTNGENYAQITDVSPVKNAPAVGHSVIGRMLSVACTPDGKTQ